MMDNETGNVIKTVRAMHKDYLGMYELQEPVATRDGIVWKPFEAYASLTDAEKRFEDFRRQGRDDVRLVHVQLVYDAACEDEAGRD